MQVEFEARTARVVAGRDVPADALLKALSEAGYPDAAVVAKDP